MLSPEEPAVLPAVASGLDTVVAILEEAARWLSARGIDQWRPGSFRPEPILKAIQRGEVYLTWVGGEPVGTLTLQWSDKPVWGDVPEDAAYVHGFAVRRSWAGRGVGRAMLRWAEGAAANVGKRYLRLDCAATNPALRAYYERAGFHHRGDKAGRSWSASLYEKPL